MSTVLLDAAPTVWTIADVRAHLPGFPDSRIRIHPVPGTATEQDVLDAAARNNQICELIDGTLVEKVTASCESALAAALIHFLYLYPPTRALGMVLAPDGFLRILPGQVRAPDVSFIRWERFPGRQPFAAAIYPVSPNLAVEILSETNTAVEMERKLRDYFASGVELVWYIDPPAQSARVFTGAEQVTDIARDGSLPGGDVLPGFTLPLRDLFDWVTVPPAG